MVEHVDFKARFQSAVESLGRLKPVLPPGEEPDEGFETTEHDEGNAEKISQAMPPAAINLFQHPEVHPVVLDLSLLNKYEAEWLLWEPETLRWRIPQDFRTSEVSDLNMGKIQAMKTLHYNDTYWQRWEVFNCCTQPFNYVYVDFETLYPPSTAQMMVSIDTAQQVRSDVEWSEEVKEYMKTACRFDGIFCPPRPLDFVEVGTVHGLLDCGEVTRRWDSVRQSDQMPTEETPEAEQLRRNLDAHRFLEINRARLQAQLPMVLNA
jgi:hypothetical protein